MAQASTLGRAVLHVLRRAGVREIFGIPGDFVLSLFKEIEESGILPFYTLSHEPAVGFAADAAARWRGAPTAAVVTYGAGALNMVNAVAGAYAERSPVVVVSGGPGISEDHTELLLHHQAKRLDSQFVIYQEVTCAQTRLADPSQVGGELQRVLTECVRQSRPVYIEVPRDLVFSPCILGPMNATEDERRLMPPPADPEAVAECVDEIESLIESAKSPVLLAGVEIRRYGLEREVAELAARLGIPVATSFMGRGLLVDSAAPLAGTYLGVAGDPQVTDLVEQSDALVMLGVILSDTNFGISKKKIDLRRCVRVLDGQVSIGRHTYPDIAIADLVRTYLARLPESRRRRIPQTATKPPDAFIPDDAPVAPDDVANAVNQLWDRSEPLMLASDMGDCLFTAMSIEKAHLVAPGYYATMGFGVPAGLGIQAASGKRAVVLVGDGAFQMTGWELGNAVRYGWDPIVIVLNNACWEMLRAFQPESKFNRLNEWRFADLANALGGEGVRVRNRRELAAALRQAIARRGVFQLIEAMLPPGSVSTTMARFTDGLKAYRRSLRSADASLR